MPTPQTKQELIQAIGESYAELMEVINQCDASVLEADFLPSASKAKCSTFSQGSNMRDLLVHAYEWQRLQVEFVANIRKGTPRDFIPEPYRKNYKEMDQVNWEKHQSTPFAKAKKLLEDSHKEVFELVDTFTDEELFGKKVFKVTYTTTMAAYFLSVTVSPYTQMTKKLKSHIRAMKKK